VSFRGLPDGTWIVTSWNIRMFTAGETEHPLTGQPTATLEGVAITHGEVLRAHGDAGVVFEGHRGRRVAGTVVDSLGVGLPNARVYVQGSGTETETDAEGRFELDHLGVGTYALHFTHPYLEQLWYEPESVEVEVEPDVNEVCRLPSGVPIELVVLGKDEDVDRDALDAALSLADLLPDRVTTLTIDPASPQRALNLRLEVGGRDRR